MKKNKQVSSKGGYTHLKYEERCVIEKLWNTGVTIRSIGEVLDRSPNTISREIRRNSVKDKYSAKKAQHKAYVKRWRSKRECLKVSMDRFLTRFVEKKLIERWSPEQISGHLLEEYSIKCSPKAVRKFVDQRSLNHLLFWSWNKKKSGRKEYHYGNAPDGRKYIEERPSLVQIGDYEIDFIVSKQSTYVLLVATDRFTKKTLIEVLPNRKHATVCDALSRMFDGIDVSSITIDNDIAFACWKDIEKLLNTQVYFTHPYHSWEKGLVENTNRWIRCFVAKRRDIGTVTRKELDEIRAFLNDRPKGCIGWKIPRVYDLILREELGQLQGVLLRG